MAAYIWVSAVRLSLDFYSCLYFIGICRSSMSRTSPESTGTSLTNLVFDSPCVAHSGLEMTLGTLKRDIIAYKWWSVAKKNYFVLHQNPWPILLDSFTTFMHLIGSRFKSASCGRKQRNCFFSPFKTTQTQNLSSKRMETHPLDPWKLYYVVNSYYSQ